MENEKIDFVIIWVDGGDKEWQKERNKYAGKDPEDTADYRFRDWENLKYWFRGVEKFAPWVNNVYFVTNGQKPEWLNLNNPKLKWIKHEDYIPKEWLPTFNANTIENNFHRIPGLSEKFVYFNDDTFITSNVTEKDFFLNDKPRYVVGLDAVVSTNEIFANMLLNNVQLINRHFDMKECINRDRKKWFYKGYGFNKLFKTFILKNYACFPGFISSHLPSSMLKSTYKEVWEKEQELLSNTSSHKFRDKQDVNQYIFKEWNICKGNFEPQNFKDNYYYEISDENPFLIELIKNRKYKMICMNDVKDLNNFEKVKKEINDAFEKSLPEKSSFEI